MIKTGFRLVKAGPDRCHFANWDRRLFNTRKGRFDSRLKPGRLRSLQSHWKKAKPVWVRGTLDHPDRQKVWSGYRFVAAHQVLSSRFIKRHTVFLINFSQWTNDWDEPRGEYSENASMHTSGMCNDPIVVTPSGTVVVTPMTAKVFNRLIKAERLQLKQSHQALHLAFLFVPLSSWRAHVVHRPAAVAKEFAKQYPKQVSNMPSLSKPTVSVTATATGKGFKVQLYTFAYSTVTSLPGITRWSFDISRDGTLELIRKNVWRSNR